MKHVFRPPFRRLAGATFALLLLGLPAHPGLAQSSPYRGLWVGEAVLVAVNEVSIPLDENNVAIAPDPETPTPTYDEASLRLIVHVNGAGQAFLLKDVAILNRAIGTDDATAEVFARDTDLALVTDPRMYPEFPPQPAVRYGSAGFDFGDARATEALDSIVNHAATGATAFVNNPSLSLDTTADRVQARNDAIAAIQPGLEDIADQADVAESFQQFLAWFDSAVVDAVAADPNDPVVAAAITNAEALRDKSFYGDTRALDMVDAVVAAVTNAPPGEEEKAAQHAAAGFADVMDLHQRFISGSVFGTMIYAAAEEAGTAAGQPGATEATIEAAMRGIPETIAAMTNALQAKVQTYDDTRSEDALDAVLAAMAETALANAALSEAEVSSLAAARGRTELATMIARYPLQVQNPTLDYNAFMDAAAFTSAPAAAAFAAAQGAIDERVNNGLYTAQSLFNAAKIAATEALEDAYRQAARAQRTELPLLGVFGPGSGDPRAMAELAQPSDLGPAGLEGRIYLPANHPTNPFRHRRHPDHTTGFNIERLIRFDFDGAEGDALESAGYGVDLITGTYREEIFGLHKPLGPDPETDPVGLRTEGRFELNRISTIDTLNTR